MIEDFLVKSSIVTEHFLFALLKKKNNHMPTKITPNVSFTNVSRELRCKWRDETALSECQDGILF